MAQDEGARGNKVDIGELAAKGQVARDQSSARGIWPNNLCTSGSEMWTMSIERQRSLSERCGGEEEHCAES